MRSEQLEALIGYRIGQAHETLTEAQILLDEATARGALNRAYYAMYYALLALLATQRLGTSKHSGAVSLFDREFVKRGLLGREHSRALHRAFERRLTHDYGEMVAVTKEMAEETLEDARAFVAAVKAYLRSQGHLTRAGEDAP